METVLAALAHDIRTPLTGILAYGELLATSEIGEREREWALGIKNTAEHLAAITSLIIDASRAKAGRLVLREESFSPRKLADAGAASLLARAATKNLSAEIVIAEDLPALAIGDELRLRAALENLIDNAVKFTERGTIRLEIACKRGARGRGKLSISVADSGIGLSAAEITRLFRPFAQANPEIARRYGGAGLGLAFVKRIAKTMGGDLTVTSQPKRGSRFDLHVAVRLPPESTGTGASADGHAAQQAQSLDILCVEDNPYGRVVLNTILTELGHRADFVGSGEAAVVAAGRGKHDLVLMDITLPGIDGIEATRRIRQLSGPARAVPIVGITGRANAPDEAASLAAGMSAYQAKPVSPSAIAEIIANTIRRKI